MFREINEYMDAFYQDTSVVSERATAHNSDRELINLLLRQIDHLKREYDEKTNIISLLIKTRKSYFIQEQ